MEPHPVGNVMSDVRYAMVADLRQGYLIREVARKYGQTYRYVSGLTKEYNIPTKRGRRVGDVDLNKLDRNAAILEAVQQGETMSSVARRLKMSRERVRQICGRMAGLTDKNKKANMRQKNLDLLAPMLDHIATGMCNRCGKLPIQESTNVHLCEICFTRRRQVGIVLQRLAYYLKRGKTRDLNQAAWVVRDFGITLEELRSY